MPRGMAGKCRSAAPTRRPGADHYSRGNGKTCATCCAQPSGDRVLATTHRVVDWLRGRAAAGLLRALAPLSLLLACCLPANAADEIVVSAVRVWPASEYTRITLESAQPITYTVFTAKNPERVVVDLEGIELGKQLRALP